MAFTVKQVGQLKDGSTGVVLVIDSQADLDLMSSLVGERIELLPDDEEPRARDQSTFHTQRKKKTPAFKPGPGVSHHKETSRNG